MIVLMQADATRAQIDDMIALIESRGWSTLARPAGEHTAIGIPSAIPPDLRQNLADSLSILAGVDHIVHVSRPYKLVSREFHSAPTIIKVKDVEIGGPA